MVRSVALIRGVGGPTALRMAELRAALEEAGLRGVTTLQVAGNVIFDQGSRSSPACAELVRHTVRERFGHDLAVIVRSHTQLVDAQHRNPFIGSQSGNWVMTVFLDRLPSTLRPAGPPPPLPHPALDPAAGGDDRFVVNDAEIFVRYESGVAGSRLQSAWFERQLGVTGTARNANTVAKLVTLTT